jgi:hypothetical protein
MPRTCIQAERRGRREHAAPQPLALCFVRQRELDHVVHAPRERLVDVVAEVAGEDHRTLLRFQLLQQVGHLDVGVAVVRVPNLGTLAEQGVGLVEEQDGPVGLRPPPETLTAAIPMDTIDLQVSRAGLDRNFG